MQIMCPHICVTAYVRMPNSAIRYLYDKNGNILAEKNGNDIVSVYIKE